VPPLKTTRATIKPRSFAPPLGAKVLFGAMSPYLNANTAIEKIVLSHNSGSPDAISQFLDQIDGSLPLPAILHGLQHELSPFAMKNSGPRHLRLDYSANLEYISARFHRETLLGSLREGKVESLEQCLLDLSKSMHGQAVELRKRPAKTESDVNGFHWIYPDPSIVKNSLRELSSFLIDTIESSPLLVARIAVVAYVLINWIHPLRDGNGRLSRMLFNILLFRDSKIMHYIPLAKFSQLAHYGQEISLREVMIGGSVKSISEYFEVVINASAAILSNQRIGGATRQNS
jgi:Fic/DOC family